MRSLLPALAFAAALAASPAGLAQQRPAAPADAGESRVALVIGNASYKDAPLANPVNDALAVSKTLNELGFQVKLHTNLTQAGMRRAIREFGDELHAKQGVGLFYYAGHGVQISNRNFLIPVGADIQREYEVEDQAVDAGAVLSMMHSAKARVNIVILDACRNNPFIRDFRSTINGLAPMQAPAGTLVAFATAPGQTAIDGTGHYGLYTEHLVENMAIPGLKIEDVFKNVRLGVQRASSGKQVPWENTSLTGDFYFRAKVTVAADDAASRGAQQADVDRAVKQALAQREQDDAARRKAQQDDIERAVQAALAKREVDLARAQTVKNERDVRASQETVDGLRKELAELRAQREAEQKAAAQASQPEAPPAAVAAPQLPAQVALAAPAPRVDATVKAGGRVEHPDVRVGDRWKYEITDRFTNLKKFRVLEVASVTDSRIYTRSTEPTLATLDFDTTAGVIDTWDRQWNQIRQGNTEFVPFYPALQFPLEVGKNWAGTVTFTGGIGATLTHDIKAQAVTWERVTVPAGSFDAIRIAIRGSYQVTGLQARGIGTINNVVWYAPAVRQLVKKEVEQRGSVGGSAPAAAAADYQQYERWELVEYKPN